VAGCGGSGSSSVERIDLVDIGPYLEEMLPTEFLYKDRCDRGGDNADILEGAIGGSGACGIEFQDFGLQDN
jgi:hypothetical protein